MQLHVAEVIRFISSCWCVSSAHSQILSGRRQFCSVRTHSTPLTRMSALVVAVNSNLQSIGNITLPKKKKIRPSKVATRER